MVFLCSTFFVFVSYVSKLQPETQKLGSATLVSNGSIWAIKSHPYVSRVERKTSVSQMVVFPQT